MGSLTIHRTELGSLRRKSTGHQQLQSIPTKTLFWARRVGGAILSMNSIAWAPFFEKGHPFEDRFLGGARTKKDTSRARRTDDTKTMKNP